MNVTLSSRSSMWPTGHGSSALGQLGLARSTCAEYGVTINFLTRALNGAGGERYVDASKIRGKARRALGSSLDWIVGFHVTSKVRDRIADAVNRELCAFVQGRRTDVRVMARVFDGAEYRLVPHDAHCVAEVPRKSVLLVPTELVSNHLFGDEVYLRVDVEHSRRAGSRFVASELLFTDEEGHSIAGFGAVAAFIVNIDDVPLALKNAVGCDYDILAVNARIFDAWWQHELRNPDEDSFEIQLGETDLHGRALSFLMERVGVSAWRVSIKVAGDIYPLDTFLPFKRFSVDIACVVRERLRLVKAIEACSHPDAAIAFDHIFDETRWDRFPDEFVKELVRDPDAAIAKFTTEVSHAVSRLRSDPCSWTTTMFTAGQERELEFIGETIDSKVQLLAPLYLTDEDRKLMRPSVFVVASLVRDNKTGKERLTFPTILSDEMERINANHLRRAIRNTYPAAA